MVLFQGSPKLHNGSQGSQLGKVVDDQAPAAAYVAPSGAIKPSNCGEASQPATSFIHVCDHVCVGHCNEMLADTNMLEALTSVSSPWRRKQIS